MKEKIDKSGHIKIGKTMDGKIHQKTKNREKILTKD